MGRFHKPNKAPQHTPTNFHEKTVSRLGTSAIVAGTGMCRPVRHWNTIYSGAGKPSSSVKGFLRELTDPLRAQVISDLNLSHLGWHLSCDLWCPEWGEGLATDAPTAAPPPPKSFLLMPQTQSRPLVLCIWYSLDFFPLITEEICNHHKKCSLRKWHKDNEKPPVLLLSQNNH